jgi:predicted nucleotidyltransferase
VELFKDFRDFIHLLNLQEVEYLVVGGYALAFHGKPRHTGDLDIWINISETNAAKMVNVLDEFGVGSLGLSRADFLKEGYVSQIGYPPLRIDILNSIDGISFPAAYRNKQTLKLEEIEISYIGLEDLIANKKATGRSQDLTDVKQLAKLPKKKPS